MPDRDHVGEALKLLREANRQYHICLSTSRRPIMDLGWDAERALRNYRDARRAEERDPNRSF